MISTHLRECLSNRTGSYLIPLLWYTGERAEQVRKEMGQHIALLLGSVCDPPRGHFGVHL